MQPPERPRHRKMTNDKWRRIIEPAGDSDSSEWSSDSDMGTGMNSARNYQPFAPTAVVSGSSSSNAAHREQHTPVSATGQSKQSREPSVFHSLNSYSFMFDPPGEPKRREGLDMGTGMSTNHFSHLLHHDYAEREANNDLSSTNDRLWFHSTTYNPLTGWRQKKQRLLNHIGPAVDYSMNVNTPSSSRFGLTSGTTPDEGGTRDPATAISSGLSQEVEGWRIVSGMERLSPPSRKRSVFVTSDSSVMNTAGTSGVSEQGTAAVPASSMQTQAQVGQHDRTGTSASMDAASHPDAPTGFNSDWYIQKKVKSRHNKEVRSNESTFRQLPSVRGLTPEGATRIVPRTSEDPSDIQVLSVAGPSNVSYASGMRCMQPVVAEEPAVNEFPQSTSGIVASDEEGVEIIMVDDVRLEPPEKRPANQPQEYCGAPGCKRMKDDDELLNQGLIGLLECPVCMEYMGPPIHQCRRGHLVCSACKPKLPNCPTCRSRFTESRNLAMEKVADKLHYPCRNAHMGCMDTLRLLYKDEHEANCAYRSYRCKMVPPCDWKGQHRDILSHVMLSHSDILLQGPEHVLEMSLGNLTAPCSGNWIVSAMDELFRVNLGAVLRGYIHIFGCVLLLGPAKRARLFRYTFTVGPADGDLAQRKLSYSRTTHCYVERCSMYYSDGDSFHLPSESARLFSSGPPNDRIIYVKLHVEKIDS